MLKNLALEQLPAPVVERLQRVARNNSPMSRLLKRFSRHVTTGPQRIRGGPAAGWLIDVAGSRPSYVLGTAEPELQAFLSEHLRPGDVFYDLGANVGYFTLVGSRLVGPEGHVRAYEPVPRSAAAIERNAELNWAENITVVAAAVSGETGTATFAEGPTDQDGRLGSGALEVRTVALDDEDGPPPTLVKIDVEGAETLAVAGMRRVLTEHRPIVLVELHDDPLSFEHPTARLLAALGYRLSWLEGDAIAWAPHLVALPD